MTGQKARHTNHGRWPLGGINQHGKILSLAIGMAKIDHDQVAIASSINSSSSPIADVVSMGIYSAKHWQLQFCILDLTGIT